VSGGAAARYYAMAGDGPAPAARVAAEPRVPAGAWYRGALLAERPAAPLVYTLDAGRPGHLGPLFDDLDAPLVREDLVAVLAAAGVDNLELYPATLVDPSTGARHEHYRAFNVVGVVAAADMARSRLAPGAAGAPDSDAPDSDAPDEDDAEPGRPLVDGDFDVLAVDAARAAGGLLFRLAESVVDARRARVGARARRGERDRRPRVLRARRGGAAAGRGGA
jgi:hypothetical protein